MKKILSAIMALCMILSICSLFVAAAPQGTAITNEAEFLAMKADGVYYLANDITVTQSYTDYFTGVFDGNGKTVTVSEPMFLEFCGSAMNLTINGEIVADHAKDNGYWARGAFACMASGEGVVTFYNIVNNANVTGFATEESATYPGLIGHAYAGGIVGACDNNSAGTDASFTLINCTNNGNVSGYHCTGGITGILYTNDSNYTGEQTTIVTNCTNNGNVESFAEYTGGIVGRVYYAVDATFTGCINNGAIQSYGNTGGIIGHTTNTSSIIRLCQNNGSVTTTTDTESTAYAGGIVGYGQGAKSETFAAINEKYSNLIEFCINTGEITGQRRVGGIIGSSGASGAYGLSHTRYCINTGKVVNRGNGTSSAQCCAGGIQGYGYGSGDNEYAYVTNCINTGAIESLNPEFGVASYFLGYISSNNAIIANNSSSGTLYAPSGKTYAIGWNNAGTYAEGTVGNNLPATSLHKLAYENGVDSEKTFDCGVFDESELALGTTVANLNAAYKTVTGATTDAFTMTIDGTFNPKVVILEAAAPEITYPEVSDETTAAPETEAPETDPPETEAPATDAPETEAPATDAPATDAPETDPPKEEGGCGSMITGGAIVIALLGVAVVAKKKEN